MINLQWTKDRIPLLLSLIGLCLLTACFGSQNGPASSGGPTPRPVPTVYRPKGLGLDSSLRGMYVDGWTTAKVSFTVMVPIKARSMSINIEVPGYYKPREQSIAVQFGSRPVQAKHGLPYGLQTVSFPVTPSLRGKTTHVDIFFDHTFVPERPPATSGIKPNGDNRRIGVFFKGISFQ